MEHPPGIDSPFFPDNKLLQSQGAKELTLGSEGKGDHIVVIGLLFERHLEDHRDPPETAPIRTGGDVGGAYAQSPGLFQGDVGNPFARRVRPGSPFLSMVLSIALVFSHSTPMWIIRFTVKVLSSINPMSTQNRRE